MQLDKTIKDRHSVRKFKKKKPDWRDIIECIDSARYAPMAGNNYTLRFILVDDKEKIKKLAEASQQDFVGQVDYIVVVCTDSSRTANAYNEFAETFCRQQAGAAIENILLSITEKGLATCWIGYFVENIVQKILGIPSNIKVEALLPIGYEDKPLSKKRLKIELDKILFFNEYDNKKMKNPKKLEV